MEEVGTGGTLDIAFYQDDDGEGNLQEIDKVTIDEAGAFYYRVTPMARYLKVEVTVATAAITFGIVAVAGNKRFKETRDKVVIIEEE